ncbi:hypothetical protein HYX00_04935 [Candidatus Woesearchaeota archaeon]|nr:hypothetical protein [Candidatus Woesearchaeota archaeon]
MNIEKIKQIYEDEWILVEVLKEDKDGNPIEVQLLEHSKNRDITYLAMKKYAKKYTYHFYTGKIPEKGYAVAF